MKKMAVRIHLMITTDNIGQFYGNFVTNFVTDLIFHSCFGLEIV